MKKTFSLLTISLLTLISCKNESKESESVEASEAVSELPKKITKASWLLGAWGNTSPEGVLMENWIKTNDSIFHGESYFIQNEVDTTFAEHMSLEQTGENLALTVTVPKQNNGDAVRFEMTSITDSTVVFENPQHDFPNKIVYNLTKKGTLVAEIFGTQNGQEASETFLMKKIK